QFGREIFSSFENLVVLPVGNNGHVRWCYIHRPNQAFLFVMGFSQRCYRSGYADSIGPHSDHDLFAVFIQHLEIQRFRVFASELENMSHFHTATSCKWPRTIWCWITITNRDRKSTRLNSSHVSISYAVF